MTKNDSTDVVVLFTHFDLFPSKHQTTENVTKKILKNYFLIYAARLANIMIRTGHSMSSHFIYFFEFIQLKNWENFLKFPNTPYT